MFIIGLPVENPNLKMDASSVKQKDKITDE